MKRKRKIAKLSVSIEVIKNVIIIAVSLILGYIARKIFEKRRDKNGCE